LEREVVRRALELLASGCATTAELREELRLSEQELQALLGALESSGLVREVKAADCAACPLRGSCRAFGRARSYALTDLGRALAAIRPKHGG